MAKEVIYGIGGYDPDMPNNNIIDIVDIPEPLVDEVQLARESALAKLTALGLTEEEARAIAGV